MRELLVFLKGRSIRVVRRSDDEPRQDVCAMSADAAEELAVELLAAARIAREGTGRQLARQVRLDLQEFIK